MANSDQENNNSTMTRHNSRQRKLLYRELLNQTENIQERGEYAAETVREIGEIIKQVNQIEIEYNITERYHHPDETLLDSMVLSSASNVLVKCVKAVDVDVSVYDPSEFANKIITFLSLDDTEDFLKLLKDARDIIPQVPQYLYTYGAYDLDQLSQPKKIKPKQTRIKEHFERKEPEKVTNLSKEETGIEEIVKVFYNILLGCFEKNNRNAIKYYDYVIDTSSFSNTVENMFYCSFLIRDGKAKLDLDSKGVPYLEPMTKQELKTFRDGHGVNAQVISTISYPEWELFTKEGYIQKNKKLKK